MYKAGQSTMGSMSLNSLNRFSKDFNQIMKTRDMNGNYYDIERHLRRKRHSESQKQNFRSVRDQDQFCTTYGLQSSLSRQFMDQIKKPQNDKIENKFK